MTKLCDYFSHHRFGLPVEECPQCNPNFMQPIRPPRPIKYDEAMRDSRKLRWRPLSAMGYCIELGRTYIGARYNEQAGVWMLGRVMWCEECGHFEMVQEGKNIHTRCHSPAHITHYAEDVLGTP